jgi:hypothetical protein
MGFGVQEASPFFSLITKFLFNEDICNESIISALLTLKSFPDSFNVFSSSFRVVSVGSLFSVHCDHAVDTLLQEVLGM